MKQALTKLYIEFFKKSNQVINFIELRQVISHKNPRNPSLNTEETNKKNSKDESITLKFCSLVYLAYATFLRKRIVQFMEC